VERGTCYLCAACASRVCDLCVLKVSDTVADGDTACVARVKPRKMIVRYGGTRGTFLGWL